MKIVDTEAWNDFISSLNNPSQEILDNRRQLFEECDKLIITRSDNLTCVESDELNEDAILDLLRQNN